ncbi:MAG: hypothetical protein KAW92_13825 [Candidatus Cloacimonetes bacterium]|nr:hypothetical protein [Candidatus Cloacimonadota bacterium]
MALKIVKITKGFGRKISSMYSYSFWDFPAIVLTAEIEIDLDKEEDKEKLKKINMKLFKAAKALINIDIKETREKDIELDKSLKKIMEKVDNDRT